MTDNTFDLTPEELAFSKRDMELAAKEEEKQKPIPALKPTSRDRLLDMLVSQQLYQKEIEEQELVEPRANQFIADTGPKDALVDPAQVTKKFTDALMYDENIIQAEGIRDNVTVGLVKGLSDTMLSADAMLDRTQEFLGMDESEGEDFLEFMGKDLKAGFEDVHPGTEFGDKLAYYLAYAVPETAAMVGVSTLASGAAVAAGGGGLVAFTASVGARLGLTAGMHGSQALAISSASEAFALATNIITPGRGKQALLSAMFDASITTATLAAQGTLDTEDGYAQVASGFLYGAILPMLGPDEQARTQARELVNRDRFMRWTKNQVAKGESFSIDAYTAEFHPKLHREMQVADQYERPADTIPLVLKHLEQKLGRVIPEDELSSGLYELYIQEQGLPRQGEAPTEKALIKSIVETLEVADNKRAPEDHSTLGDIYKDMYPKKAKKPEDLHTDIEADFHTKRKAEETKTIIELEDGVKYYASKEEAQALMRAELKNEKRSRDSEAIKQKLHLPLKEKIKKELFKLSDALVQPASEALSIMKKKQGGLEVTKLFEKSHSFNSRLQGRLHRFYKDYGIEAMKAKKPKSYEQFNNLIEALRTKDEHRRNKLTDKISKDAFHLEDEAIALENKARVLLEADGYSQATIDSMVAGYFSQYHLVVSDMHDSGIITSRERDFYLKPDYTEDGRPVYWTPHIELNDVAVKALSAESRATYNKVLGVDLVTKTLKDNNQEALANDSGFLLNNFTVRMQYVIQRNNMISLLNEVKSLDPSFDLIQPKSYEYNKLTKAGKKIPTSETEYNAYHVKLNNKKAKIKPSKDGDDVHSRNAKVKAEVDSLEAELLNLATKEEISKFDRKPKKEATSLHEELNNLEARREVLLDQLAMKQLDEGDFIVTKEPIKQKDDINGDGKIEMTYLVDGKKEAIYVDPVLMPLIENAKALTPDQQKFWARVAMGSGSKPLSAAWVHFNMAFPFRAMLRDATTFHRNIAAETGNYPAYMTQTMYQVSGAKHFIENVVGGNKDVISPKQLMRWYDDSDGNQFTLTSMTKQLDALTIEAAFKKQDPKFKTAWDKVSNFIQIPGTIAEKMVRANAAYRLHTREGMSAKDAVHEVNNSLDYGRRGSEAAKIQALIPFYSTIAESLRAGASAYQKNPKLYAKKMGVYMATLKSYSKTYLLISELIT
jgi:hypothetical protein